jgi:DNA gyrase inhibitor GyrI
LIFLSYGKKNNTPAANWRDWTIIFLKETSTFAQNFNGMRSSTENIYQQIVNQVIDYISANLHKPLLLDGIAAHVCFDDPNVTKSDRCRFYASATVQKEIAPTGIFGTIRLRKGKYAVYTFKGSYDGLQEFYNRICLHPDYSLRHGMAFEEYLNSPHDTKEEDLLTKIFIPIK